MSMFIGNQNQYQKVDPQKVKVAEVQFEAQSTVFNKILLGCEEKCIAREFGEGDLNAGEQSCIDRCVLKFFKANLLVGESLQYNRQFNIQKMPEYKKIELMMNKDQ